jgi:hypothetical protein
VYGEERDERLDAALPLSGTGCFLTNEMVGDTAVPIMAMTGSEDLLVARAGNRMIYDRANAPRYWVELLGGSHVRFSDVNIDDELVATGVRRDVEEQGANQDGDFFGGDAEQCGDEPVPAGEPKIDLARQQELLRTFATPFFDAYLRDDASARRFLEDELPGITANAARYEFDAG